MLHYLLVLKLKKIGFTGKLLKWFESYLSGRQQIAVISGCKSGWLNVTSGVPQGSILGPLLFLLYINDLPDNIKNSIVALFADDCKAFKQIRSQKDCCDFQEDIDNFYYWSKKCLMNFNILKCHVITITTNKFSVLLCYKMNGVPLICVTELLELGINVDSTLYWSPHIKKTVSKANRVCGLMKLEWHAPHQTKSMLYCALARQILEYRPSTPLWSETSFSNVRLVERVQRSMTKYICNFSADSYKERLLKIKMLPLSMRRERNDVIFFWKCLNGKYEVDISKYVFFSNSIDRCTRSSRSSTDEGFLVKVFFCKTERFRKSYFPRIVYLWNSLPQNVRRDVNNYLESFMKDIDKILLVYLNNHFQEITLC